jgi:methanesulfonate monooxygenase small subunit
MANESVQQGAARASVCDLIYRACLLLDDEKFLDWLQLCASEFKYSIKAFSPEIGKEMIWFERDNAGLKATIEMLPRHNTDHGRLTRHATVYAVDIDTAAKTASAVTSFACYRTMLDGINSHLDAGETQLFLIGKYYDRISLAGGQPRFLDRVVYLDTRRLDKGSHYPI